MRYLIGAGNWAMGDDSIGLRVAEHVAMNGLEKGFEAVDIAGDALRLLDYFIPETEQILIVDAVNLGIPPGDFLIFSPDEVETRKELAGLSTHEGDILKVIAIAGSLGYRIPPLRILGIQPERMEGGMELSGTLKGRFEDYVRAALAEIAK
jgi:hydrogenase maturation protease